MFFAVSNHILFCVRVVVFCHLQEIKTKGDGACGHEVLAAGFIRNRLKIPFQLSPDALKGFSVARRNVLMLQMQNDSTNPDHTQKLFVHRENPPMEVSKINPQLKFSVGFYDVSKNVYGTLYEQCWTNDSQYLGVMTHLRLFSF